MVDPMPMVNSETSEDVSRNQTVCVRPRILLTGLRRSGKTSIQRVIFTKMQPSQTQFLESTPQLITNQFSCGSFINFQVQELPGQLHVFPSMTSTNGQHNDDDDSTQMIGNGYNMERLLKRCHAIVYIIDAQDAYSESITRLNLIIELGRRVNPKLRYEIFIHKVDQLSEEGKFDTQRDIHNQVRDSLADIPGGIDAWPSISNSSKSNAQNILINFHLTSIYDHSIFEAFSKVIQKLIPQSSYLEHLLTHLLSASNIEQVFLFDVQTKISIATDASPTDMQMYELCCDMIDLLINMSEIYSTTTTESTEWKNEILTSDSNPDEDDDDDSAELIEKTNIAAPHVFDSMSSSVIKLTGGRVLYLKEINRHLALICILREEALTRQAFIDYNIKQLKESILKLFQLSHKT